MRGVSKVIEAVLILIITASIITLTYQWSFEYSSATQEKIEKNLAQKGCLKIENIDVINKKITIRNCGDNDLSNFIVYLDSESLVSYSGNLSSGNIAQISYTGVINEGDHEIFVSSTLAETPKIIFNIPIQPLGPCDFYIYQSNMTNTYSITQSNKLYCLAQNVYIGGQTATNFSSVVQNTTLDCQGYNVDGNDTYGTSGIYLLGSNTKNNIISNCSVTDFEYGIYLDNSPNNNVINNTITSILEHGIQIVSSNNYIFNNRAINDEDGIYIDGSNNIILDNIFQDNSAHNVHLNSGSNNSISGGSITMGGTNYFLGWGSVGSNNNFTNTNFTATRSIYLFLPTYWFNYRNDSSSDIWLKTNALNASIYEITINRKLTNWDQDLIKWNDTFYNDTGLTLARYNITGLLINTNYTVYNNSIPAYTINSSSKGEINFTINLPANQAREIKIERYIGVCQIFINSLPYNIIQNNTYYCLSASFVNLGTTAIQFGNTPSQAIQNSTIDCRGFNIDGQESTDTFGIYLYNDKNNTLKDCIITDFDMGIEIDGGSNSNIITNCTSISNYWYGIELAGVSNNTIINSTFNSNNDGAYIWSNSKNNTIINSAFNLNSNWGIRLDSTSSYNTIINSTFNSNDWGIMIYGSQSNSIKGGSIKDNYGDYFLNNANSTNNFTNTDFISSRKIFFDDVTSWFIYNNETTGNIWLKTSVSAISTITRKLLNWNQNLMQWNDTFSNTSGSITARYNITGLLPGYNYDVYNSTALVYTLSSGPSGAINFTIYLPANQERRITVEIPACVKRGSIILTPEGFKRIEDLKTGDYVIGYKDGKRIKAKITKTAVHDGEWVLYYYKGYWFTGNHKVYTDYDNFEQVSKLSSITERYEGKVYDITVADTGNFFGVDGLLIHNK